MAFQQAFTDATGTDHPAAYWRAVQINIAASDSSIRLTFYAFKDAAAFGTGKQPLPGASKSYTITGAEFLAVAASAPVGATLYEVLAHASEAYAVGKADTPTGATGGDGSPVLASFFAGATQV